MVPDWKASVPASQDAAKQIAVMGSCKRRRHGT